MSTESKPNLLLILVIAVLAAFGAYFLIESKIILNDAAPFYVYNPHDEVLTVQIDQKTYLVETGKKQEVPISLGTHHVTASLNEGTLIDTSIQFTRSMEKSGGLLNLSGESFYLWTELYGSGITETIYNTPEAASTGNASLSQIIEKEFTTLQIDSTLVYGNIKAYPPNQLFIEKVWFYNIDEAFKEKVQSSNQSDLIVGKSISKIFDKKSFLRYWKAKQSTSILE